jgi:hypothetical protein
VKQGFKALLTRYGICFGVASLIAFVVFWINGFFTHSAAVNLQIVADGISIAGLLLLLFAAMMYVSGEGGLLGIGYVMQCVIQAFVPMGRKNHESYASYRERKIGRIKKPGDNCIFITGFIFFVVGIILLFIWNSKFNNVSL